MWGKGCLILSSLAMLLSATCVASLWQGPKTSQLFVGIIWLSSDQREMSLNVHKATEWGSDVCHSDGLLPGIRLGVFSKAN